MILQLSTQQLRRLRVEARKVHPIEACALLFGKTNREKAVLESVIITPNVLKSTVRFEIDPKTFYDAFTQAQKDGFEFIGLFHSHPAPAYPSGVDLDFMRLWGNAIWLIMSSIDSNFAAFQISKGKVKRVTLKRINFNQ